jgi:NADH-quinone oxidoreductase subunit E
VVILNKDDVKNNVPKQKKIDLDLIDKILNKYNPGNDALISILQDIQTEYNYLPKDALIHVSEKLQLPLIQVYGVATFFKAFSLTPRGDHIINVCLGTACHVRASKSIIQRIEQDLDIKDGETTEDMKFTLETVNCLGACALGPVMVVDGEYHGHMKPNKVSKLIKQFS